jgi:glyoxylase-like metal-dependent hydrolase (beta-lactamase superfamily II)
MEELAAGVRRVTTPLPTRPGHVHSYLLPGQEGWTLVDTGLGLPDTEARWTQELGALDRPVSAIVVTHFHPDHVGAAADLAALTGAPVYQGGLDYAQCELVWGNPNWPHRVAEWFHRHGTPVHVTDELVEQGNVYRPFIRYQPDPVIVGAGDTIGDWQLMAAPGHADGQLVLHRDGVLIAADHVLDPISPTVGLWPASRPDPLADYLNALERTIELAPRIAFGGHGETIEDPVARCRTLIEHHRGRLDAAESALGAEPQSGYEISFALFGTELKPAARRFAVAETLSHLERLCAQERAERSEVDGLVTYTRGASWKPTL